MRHFRTDISYLPDLTAYLDDLLRSRERLAAAGGADDWARAAAAPSEQEIAKIRQLISHIKGDIAGLTPPARAHRRSRRRPRAPCRQPRHASPAPGGTAMT